VSGVRAALVLVPGTLDHGAEAGDIRDVLADGVLRRAAALVHWVAEDARTTRAFLKRVHAVHPLARPLQELDVQELPRARKGAGERVDAQAWRDLLAPALAGHDVALHTEAGLPALADPGAELVAAAHDLGVPVQVLPGPSAVTLALAAGGLNGQSFAFVGYVPQDAAARVARLRELEVMSRRLHQTQLLIEAPYRNRVLFDAMLAALAGDTRVSVSQGLTLPAATSRTLHVDAWRREPWRPADDVPAVFALLAAPAARDEVTRRPGPPRGAGGPTGARPSGRRRARARGRTRPSRR
jgi:16S rRNA (cytidine1402-2'-O)-methyltransferase